MKEGDQIEVVETTKGKPLALLNGYQHRIHRSRQDGSINWACVKDKSLKCKGRVLTVNNVVSKFSMHSCRPDVAATEVVKSMNNARKRARIEECAASKIFKEEFTPLFNHGYDFVTQIPKLKTAKTTLNRIRRKAQGLTKEPNSAEDIVIPVHGSNFVLFDEKQEERLIAFGSMKGREILASGKTCFMDGTFKSCSKQFTQVYTIHVDIGSLLEETNVIPVIFALLRDKRFETYYRLFSRIKSCIPEWNPNSSHMDFEVGAINAILKVFPSIKVKGCNFHFNQCLWRKVQELGLVVAYNEDEDIRVHIRMCAALAYLPVTDVDDGWLSIIEHAPQNEKLRMFFDYFVDQWLENRIISKEMWNCNGERHRTNNAVEGWNCRLNKSLSQNHPTFSQLFNCLNSEAEYSDFLQDRASLHLEGNKRKKCYIKRDERILKAMASYQEDNNIKKCLKVLSYLQRLE